MRNIRLKQIAIFLFIIFVLFIGYNIYNYFKVYEGYSITYKKDINSDKYSYYEDFNNNIIKYSLDGVSLLDYKNNSIWNVKYEIRNPKLEKSKKYFVIYDKMGNEIYIYDKSGKVGEINTKTIISKVCISDSGSVGVVTEDKKSTYVSIYDKTGGEQNINIKSLIDGNGYPIDIAIDDTGYKLFIAYEKINGDLIDGSVVFYDFTEKGQSFKNKIVGGFEEEFKDSMIAKVKYFDENHAFAISDKKMIFFGFDNLVSPVIKKEIEYKNKIRSLFIVNDKIVVVYSSGDINKPNILEVYDKFGKLHSKNDFDFSYKKICADNKNIYLFNDKELLICRLNTRKRFIGKIDGEINIIKNNFGNTYTIVTNESIRKIRLK